MRNLREFSLPMGFMPGIEGTPQSGGLVVPCDCELFSMYIYVDAAIAGDDHSFDIRGGSNVDALLPIGFVSGEVELTGVAFFEAGEEFQVSSNGETTAAATAFITPVFRRTGSGPTMIDPGAVSSGMAANEVAIAQTAVLTAITTPGNISKPMIAPFNCELTGVAIAHTADLDDDHSYDVIVNGVESSVDVLCADESRFGRYPMDGKIFLSRGDAVQYQTNGESSAGNAFFTSIFARR